jgi:phage-related protein
MDEHFKYKVIISDEVDIFFSTLNPKAVRKIITNITAVAKGLKDRELFKKLDGTDIWEFRTLYSGIAYRLLAFWDTTENSLIVTTHGFIKKTDKTPKKEIEKAERKRKEYFASKK